MPTIDFMRDKYTAPVHIFETAFIKLETNNECFIDKTITQIEFDSDNFFVLSGGNDRRVFAFGRSGDFIAQIGTRGGGPGEYLVPMSFSIDDKREIISILDMVQRKILHYDLNHFSFISEEKVKHDSSCFEYLKDGKMVWKNIDYRSDNSKWEFLITDAEQNLLDKVIEKKFMTGYSTGRIKTLYKTCGRIFAYSQYDSRIYCFQDDDVIPAYNLTFGKHALPPMDYLQKISANNTNFISELSASDYISNYSVFDANKTLCVYYFVAQTPYVGIYDKETRQARNYTLEAFQSNLQTGIIDRISGATDQYIIAILQPFDLSEKQNQGYVFSPELQPLVTKSLSDDNPILCLFRTKAIR